MVVKIITQPKRLIWGHIWQEAMMISHTTLPETPSGGGQIPEMIQVCDYDILIALVELNTLI